MRLTLLQRSTLYIVYICDGFIFSFGIQYMINFIHNYQCMGFVISIVKLSIIIRCERARRVDLYFLHSHHKIDYKVYCLFA